MKTSDVIKHFGTQTATARALGILQSSVSEWDAFPPAKRQLQIERITNGELQAEPGCFEKVTGLLSLKVA